jgi:hypothetical protein
MTPLEIRIAIAKAIGLEKIPEVQDPLSLWDDVAIAKMVNEMSLRRIPDFTGDLNAANDAIIKLCNTTDKKLQFNYYLSLPHWESEVEILECLVYFANNTASALEKCTALLRALDLWEELQK